MSWIKYKNIHSDDMGLTVEDYPAITRAEQRIETVKIPGRHGEVVLVGTPAYEAYVKECKCVIAPDADIAALNRWLSGRGDLIFGNEPEYIYSAQVISELPFEKILREREYREVNIPFLCQPLKRLVNTESDIVLSIDGTTTVINPGNVASRPLIKIEGTGTIQMMIGTDSITTVEGLNGAILIDSEIGIATDTQMVTNMSAMVSGDWPTIDVGSVPVSYMGNATKITITPRWRFL